MIQYAILGSKCWGLFFVSRLLTVSHRTISGVRVDHLVDDPPESEWMWAAIVQGWSFFWWKTSGWGLPDEKETLSNSLPIQSIQSNIWIYNLHVFSNLGDLSFQTLLSGVWEKNMQFWLLQRLNSARTPWQWRRFKQRQGPLGAKTWQNSRVLHRISNFDVIESYSYHPCKVYLPTCGLFFFKVKWYSASHTLKTTKYVNYHLFIILVIFYVSFWWSFIYHFDYHLFIILVISCPEMIKA